ncbi:acyltransferase family protein [Mucilaginibacter jinjuensis]|uniref:Acyltransferase n=1 Tax=Mucilaginibacter jinjuensis TaxID=1176721 RepID=A0ABY7TCD4_9SPHI|nr:acyltransferase [Mucilaginibacter jinjuensis]WCT13735.1 acyltransferase [Mucilaginibacter jinjuensis]
MHRNTNSLYPLRFLAALTVVLYHYTPKSIQHDINFIIKNGNEAVNFFFFISGFVMVLANGNFLKDGSATFSKWDFYVKRLARIYPLYLFAIIALAIFHYLIRPIDTNTVKYRLIFETLGIQRWLYAGSFNYPGWTLSSEFFFYAFFPFTFVLMKKDYRYYKKLVIAYFVLALIITGILFKIEHHEGLSPAIKKITSILYLHPIFKISIFLLGTICGKVFIDNKISFFQKPLNSVLCVCFCFLIIFFTKQLLPIDHYLLNGGILAIAYFLLVLAITSFDKTKTPFFNNKFIIMSGEISYGIYILQYPVYIYFTSFIRPITDSLSLSIFVVVLISVSIITYYSIELPVKNLILNLYKRNKAAKNSQFVRL